MRTNSLIGVIGVIGAGATLVLGCGAQAEVTLMAVQKDISGFEQFVSLVVNVYALFDGSDPDANFLTVVGGLPGEEATVAVLGGVFYQNPGNIHGDGHLAPPADDIPFIPGLAVDSFVTIGRKTNPGDDATQLSDTFVWDDDQVLQGGTWHVMPQDLQGHVGHADNGANTVLIGQFSVAAGAEPDASIVGTLFVQGIDDGVGFQSVASFASVIPVPGALWFVGAAGLCMASRRRRRGRVRR